MTDGRRLFAVAMFVGTEPTEVVTSAFLLILGYFFGQATGRRRSDSNKAQPSE
jgi:hypothetical protein